MCFHSLIHSSISENASDAPTRDRDLRINQLNARIYSFYIVELSVLHFTFIYMSERENGNSVIQLWPSSGNLWNVFNTLVICRFCFLKCLFIQ